MHAVVLERNKLVGRKIARLLHAAGHTAALVEEPLQLAGALADAELVCADVFDGDHVAEAVRRHAGLRAILWTAEPLKRALRYLGDAAGIDHVLARKDFESAPRAWEVAMVARRLATSAPAGPPALPFGAFLDWGFAERDFAIRTTADRDAATLGIGDFVMALQAPRRVADMFSELAHELVMNAMYGAPIDAAGTPKYAFQRKADIALEEHERPTARIGSDGTRLVLQVCDPFGRLERHHVIDGLARGLAGELDESRGGAGLGMTLCHNASSAMFFDVARGRSTAVTAVFELDVNLRELRTQAKSLHFWST